MNMETISSNANTNGLIFEPIPIGFKNNVAYLLADAQTRDAAIVDAGFKPDLILDRIQERGLRLNYIIATHRHLDHIGAAGAIREVTHAHLAAYKTVPDIDRKLDEGDRLLVGSIPIDVLHTPGHTPDCICLLVAGRKLLTGDTMYVGKVPGASHCNKREAEGFYEGIHRLMDLDDRVEVWPGHDVGKSSSSTIGRERRENSCVAMSFREFWKGRTNDKATGKWIVKPSK
jgi:hydroxyacylglutathione hydrolase